MQFWWVKPFLYKFGPSQESYIQFEVYIEILKKHSFSPGIYQYHAWGTYTVLVCHPSLTSPTQMIRNMNTNLEKTFNHPRVPGMHCYQAVHGVFHEEGSSHQRHNDHEDDCPASSYVQFRSLVRGQGTLYERVLFT